MRKETSPIESRISSIQHYLHTHHTRLARSALARFFRFFKPMPQTPLHWKFYSCSYVKPSILNSEGSRTIKRRTLSGCRSLSLHGHLRSMRYGEGKVLISCSDLSWDTAFSQLFLHVWAGERLLAVRRFCLDATFTATQVVSRASTYSCLVDNETHSLKPFVVPTLYNNGHEWWVNTLFSCNAELFFRVKLL